MNDLYPLVTYSFTVDWGEGETIGFTEVSGLDFETEVVEYRDGASSEYTKIKRAGQTKYSNITLKRGTFQGDNKAFDWWKKTEENRTDRRDITIKLLNEEREPVLIWEVRKAWVSKFQSTGLKADGSEVAIETMEIVHEGLTLRNDN